MNSLARKQRERESREQLILDSARHILCHEGLASLTMERIASEIEYSKGTVYNHFSSKEDILSALGARCMRQLLELVSRGATHPAATRDRISAVIIAHSLYARLNPVEFQNMQLIKSQSLRDKVSTEQQQQVMRLEQLITDTVIDIVKQAIARRELPEQGHITINDIVYGLWSMAYGTNLLATSGIAFSQLGLCNPQDSLWDNSQRLLDSYQWRPLSHEFDISLKHHELCQELFSDEFKNLATVT